MSHIDTGGGGRQKTFEPNLVPIIDLMSVLITFLLITAVWTQVSMIQIGSSIYGKKNADSPEPVKPPEGFETVLKLQIKSSGYILTVGTKSMSIPVKGAEFDDEVLLTQLEEAKKAYPKKQDAIIEMEDSLPYVRLINGMDSFLKAGFPQISVGTGGPG
jgi:biopolymer transport protein TolR